MEKEVYAEVLRIIGRAALELADVIEPGPGQAAPADTATSSTVPPELPAYEAKRVKYLQAFVDAGGTLTLAQVRVASKKAGMGNPGSVTSRGYVEKTGPDTRAISNKGKAWLAKRNGTAA
ncbi:hypothetical protein [Nocardioides lianchengensis]|uniref:Uncharacterized protein n=1 Tax=Nocardioides lianchengensis TaxID=1045774 RepID=A0A1G6J4B6_9ACTN|nr:hypothetical protein [Nocardioides lianchengensis]NYG12856.1 hypothetical protein [Nocardioides lianchengensis]SDC13652.1 hypothetical protein SAMN05421872_101370 [Nocardioides lianchengensis]